MTQTEDFHIQQRIDTWLKANIDEETKQEILTLRQTNPQGLKDAFYTKLNFGTGGIRAKVGLGSNRLNEYTIQMASQALANYLQETIKENISVLIGYDSRIHSLFFAEQTAKVLAANKITVYLLQNLRPTPFISFAMRYIHCSAAVMITASHNAPEYNGYKVYWSDGGQVLPPHDTGIIKAYESIENIDQVNTTHLADPLIHLIDEKIDEKYLQCLQNVGLFSKKTKKEGSLLKVIYTNLHGTGITLAPSAFQNCGFVNFTTVKKQEAPDGTFPFAPNPNPENPEALSLGMQQLCDTEADILIANDPDADRMAAAVYHEEKGYILSGNEIACIFAYHICHSLSKNKKIPKNGAFIKTIVTTELFKEIVDSYDLQCFEVLTGFKYIAEKIHLWEKNGEWEFLLGAEESYGYLKGDYCRDKDGISAGCLLAEVALIQKKKDKTLLDLLYEIYHKYGIYREGQKCIEYPDNKEGMEKSKALMRHLREAKMTTLGSLTITQVDDYLQNTRTNLLKKTTEQLSLPLSDVLVFWFSDETKLVIRPSGTEPKIKIYGQVVEKNIENFFPSLEKTNQRLQNILEMFTHVTQ